MNDLDKIYQKCSKKFFKKAIIGINKMQIFLRITQNRVKFYTLLSAFSEDTFQQKLDKKDGKI